ncbi:MAG: DUF935 family protein [Leptolyngbyaceae cyanobacterium CSU_1_4]|nr:DUF935 family protein [Leptolyngbyaceae cyanobacterium CSU_1_4]
MSLTTEAKGRVLDEVAFMVATGNLRPVEPIDLAEIAEEPEPDTPDRLTTQSLQQSQSVIEDWLTQVKALMGRSPSLESFRDSLFDLYSEMPDAGMAGMMGEAMAIAELGGRYEVIEEGKSDSVTDFASVEFAAKSKPASGAKKLKQCKKGYSCGYACIATSRICGSPLPGQASTYAQWMAMQGSAAIGAAPAPAPTTKPAKAKRTPTQKSAVPVATQPTITPQPTGSIKTNDAELSRKRQDLVDRFGAKLVSDAENNVKRVLDNTDVFIRVGSSDTLEKILGDRFRTSAELGVDSHQIPYLKGSYQKARSRTEAKVLGYDEKTTAAGDRPIYGYLGSKDLGGNSHSDVARAYGSITLKA